MGLPRIARFPEQGHKHRPFPSKMDEPTDKRDVPTDLTPELYNNNVEKATGKGHVEDSLAANYVDPSLRLDEEQNRKLVRRIHWQ